MQHTTCHLPDKHTAWTCCTPRLEPWHAQRRNAASFHKLTDPNLTTEKSELAAENSTLAAQCGTSMKATATWTSLQDGSGWQCTLTRTHPRTHATKSPPPPNSPYINHRSCDADSAAPDRRPVHTDASSPSMNPDSPSAPNELASQTGQPCRRSNLASDAACSLESGDSHAGPYPCGPCRSSSDPQRGFTVRAATGWVHWHLGRLALRSIRSKASSRTRSIRTHRCPR
jgi:hypothetical protein